ncbi:MAG: OB-fold nucleic acid binding domain-containing protein, partial [Clostridia bacterium]|nr:OB-fold nucleic acid binding domain-containing protein [Clostridia bacterium]
MTEILNEIRKIQSLNTAIISSVSLTKSQNSVEVDLVTDKSYSSDDELQAKRVIRKFVPDYFAANVKIFKLTPDCDMVKKKVFSLLSTVNRQLAAFVTEDDIRVEKTDDGFYFEIAVIHASSYSSEVAEEISARMSKIYCGNFRGKCVDSKRSLDDYEVEEKHENIQYEIPVRTFEIRDFEYLESTVKQTTAVYLADLNFLSESVAVCGTVTDIRERQITNSSGKERTMFNFTVTDTTATLRISYFARQKFIEKIRKIKVGDSIVLTCKPDVYNGMVRPTANFIDFGKIPENFVPERRASKPVPKYYETVFPEPFMDYTQSNLFV